MITCWPARINRRRIVTTLVLGLSAVATPAAPGSQNGIGGLRLVSVEDGATVAQREADQASWVAQPLPGSSAYVYFQVDDSFKWATSMNATVTVEYLDAAPGRLGVEFDGEDQTAPLQGAYSRVEKIELKGDRNWKTAVFRVRQASFTGRQNGGADFRLVAETPGFAVRKVTLERN